MPMKLGFVFSAVLLIACGGHSTKNDDLFAPAPADPAPVSPEPVAPPVEAPKPDAGVDAALDAEAGLAQPITCGNYIFGPSVAKTGYACAGGLQLDNCDVIDQYGKATGEHWYRYQCYNPLTQELDPEYAPFDYGCYQIKDPNSTAQFVACKAQACTPWAFDEYLCDAGEVSYICQFATPPSTCRQVAPGNYCCS
jgi:hypothetical protein